MIVPSAENSAKDYRNFGILRFKKANPSEAVNMNLIAEFYRRAPKITLIPNLLVVATHQDPPKSPLKRGTMSRFPPFFLA
jgi:hypothetical protein